MKPESDDPLERMLANLPVDVMPPHSLWPGIAAQVQRGAPRRMSYRAAACIALAAAGLASLSTWATFRHLGASVAPQAVVQAGMFGEPNDPRYFAARDDLERTFRERLVLLEPTTRAQIEGSLIVIRDAQQKIRRALVDDPSNSVLLAIWQSSWRDEIDLYDHVVQVTDAAQTRS